MPRSSLLLLLAAARMAACQPASPGEADAPDAHDDAHAGTDAHTSGDAHGDAHGDAGHGDAHEALPLRPIMQRLGADMAALTYALWTEDFEQMATHAERIAEHAHISDEEVRRIQATLGAEMSRFEAVDMDVHEAALRLKAAVEARDMDQTLQRLSEVQTGCASCHTQFRERLLTAPPAP